MEFPIDYLIELGNISSDQFSSYNEIESKFEFSYLFVDAIIVAMFHIHNRARDGVDDFKTNKY